MGLVHVFYHDFVCGWILCTYEGKCGLKMWADDGGEDKGIKIHHRDWKAYILDLLYIHWNKIRQPFIVVVRRYNQFSCGSKRLIEKKKRGEGKAKKKDKDNIISNTTKERRKNGTAGKAEQVMKYIARCKLGDTNSVVEG